MPWNGFVKSENTVTESGRTREIFSILPEGIKYYEKILADYQAHISGVDSVLNSVSCF